MKTIILLSSILLFFNPQKKEALETTRVSISEKLPSNWEVIEDTVSRYTITTTHYDYFLLGDFFQKTQIKGEYTCGLPGHKVKWNNVRISTSNALDQPFDEGTIQPIMENFTYCNSDNMLEESSFKDFPPTSFMLKNLVWDMMCFEGLSRGYTDSLELNKEFRVKDAGQEMDLPGGGKFQNRDVRITWLGYTRKNEKNCAIIKFSVLNNPLSVDNEQLKMKGRSNYWGNVYLALDTKQIEFAELYEDVVSDIKIPGMEDLPKMNTIRTIVLERKSD